MQHIFESDPDILNGNFWIVSDNHFGHIRLHKEYCPERNELAKAEGFTSFDEYQIVNWNKKLSYDDVIVNLGDFFINKRKQKFTIENITKILPRLSFTPSEFSNATKVT
jgi:calcineurin-like phosphoesterase family protein